MEEDVKKCIEQAERFLALREHNCSEITLKLKNKGYGDSVIEKTIEFLKDSNELDEERFIRSFIRSNNTRHPEGKSVLLARLVQKGTDKELSKTVLNEVYTEEYNAECLQKAINRQKNGKKDKEKIFAKLMSSGFSYSEIKKEYNSDIGI